MVHLPKSLALVYDRVNKWGGAEQLLLALHDLFPDAPLYTAVSDLSLAPWAKVFPKVIPTFLNSFPKAKSAHELYPFATPIAFESLDFSGYDAVISVTSSDAKGIITKPGTFHLCYCLTPTRYLYTHPVIPWPLSNYLKYWDQIASSRPDAYIAISQTVQKRISALYHRDSVIVFPPVNIEKYQSVVTQSQNPAFENYFLWVGRLVYHKQPDLVIKLFNRLGLPLVVVGTGRLYRSLRSSAGPHIKFTGFVSEPELISLYRHAQALVSVHEEDFGLVYAEAQASGLPVLALNTGGVGEVVVHHKTGYLASDLPDLKQALLSFNSSAYDRQYIARHSNRFNTQRFYKEFVKVFTHLWTKYKNTPMY